VASNITNLRVELEKPGRIDGGKFIKPVYYLKWFQGDQAKRRQINCSGENKPLGQDLVDACEGLGLTSEEVWDIPIYEYGKQVNARAGK